MLQAIVCGYLGADAECKSENGKEFTTFRVAHTDRWQDANGNQREATQWVDIILNGHPNVVNYLKTGTLVYVSGHCRLRCYSSAAARSFVAGMTISATHIELLGGQTDAIPRKLYSQDGTMHDVNKYFHCDAPGEILNNGKGKYFAVDDNGWVLPLADAPEDIQKQVTQVDGSAQLNQAQQEQNQPANTEAKQKTTNSKRSAK